MENKLIGVLAHLTGKSVDSLAEELKDSEEKDIEKLLNDAVKSKVKAARDEGYDRGKKEVSSIVEKTLSDKLEIEFTDLKDLLSKVEKPKAIESKEVTPELIRKSETYINDVRGLKEAKEKAEAEFKTFKQETETNTLKTTLRTAGLNVLKNSKFKLPSNEKILDRYLNEFVNELLNAGDYELINGEIIPLTKGSKDKLKDSLLNSIGFKDLSLQLAEDFFEINTDDKGNPTPVNTSTTGNAPQKTFGIKTPEDYYSKLSTLDKVEDIHALQAEFEMLSKNN